MTILRLLDNDFLIIVSISILQHQKLTSSRNTLENTLGYLNFFEDEREKKAALSVLAKQFINPDILDYLNYFEEQERSDRGDAIYEVTGLKELDPNSKQILEKLKAPLKKNKCLDLIKFLNSKLPTLILDSPDNKEFPLNFRLGNLLLLQSFNKNIHIFAQQPLEVQKQVIFSSIAAYLSFQEQQYFSISDDKENLFSLFLRPAMFLPDFETELIERMQALPDDLSGFCKNVIEEHATIFPAARAARLIGAIRDIRAIPILINCLSHAFCEFSFEQAIAVLKTFGDRQVVGSLGEILKKEEITGAFAIMEILQNYPYQEAVDIILDNFDNIWINHPEATLNIISDLASPGFIQLLKKETKEGELYAESVYLLLCDLHNVQDPELENIRRREKDHQARIEKTSKALFGPDSNLDSLARKSLNIELKCQQCKRIYHYNINKIHMDSNSFSLVQQVRCKYCDVIDEYEFTTQTHMAIFTESLTRLAIIKEKGIEAYKGVLKFPPKSKEEKITKSYSNALNVSDVEGVQSYNNSKNYLKTDAPSSDEQIPNIPHRSKKVGRNQPCPCGSGKKYKKCCMLIKVN